MDELEYYNGALTGAEIDKRIVSINCGTVSSLPTTITDAKITAKHAVIEAYVTSPAALAGDWSVTAYDGYLVISGTLNVSTTLTLLLGIPY